MNEHEIEHDVLNQIRTWLKSGATIKATDINSPILEILSDNTVNGNLTITGGGTNDCTEKNSQVIEVNREAEAQEAEEA